MSRKAPRSRFLIPKSNDPRGKPRGIAETDLPRPCAELGGRGRTGADGAAPSIQAEATFGEFYPKKLNGTGHKCSPCSEVERLVPKTLSESRRKPSNSFVTTDESFPDGKTYEVNEWLFV